jgi:hypothetical protein
VRKRRCVTGSSKRLGDAAAGAGRNSGIFCEFVIIENIPVARVEACFPKGIHCVLKCSGL